jgi:hypothetical protein
MIFQNPDDLMFSNNLNEVNNTDMEAINDLSNDLFTNMNKMVIFIEIQNKQKLMIFFSKA